jgi:hypothetical protein
MCHSDSTKVGRTTDRAERVNVASPAASDWAFLDVPAGTPVWEMSYQEGWISAEECPEYFVGATLYRFLRPRRWVLLTTSWHFEIDHLQRTEAKVITDAEAVDLLLEHGFVDVPDDLRHLVQRRDFWQQLSCIPPAAATPTAVPTEPRPTSAEHHDRVDPEALAIACLFKHSDWSLRQIASHVGVNRQTLYGWPAFRKVAIKADKLTPREPKSGSPRRGHKTADGWLEAYDDRDEDE